MKKIMLASGAVSSALLIIGLVLKFGHWPGAAVCLVLAILALSFVFLPLLFTLKIKEKRSSKEKAIVALGAFAAILISLGVLFKIMHLPFANVMCLGAIGIMLLFFLPVYFFAGIRNVETKVNTIVSSVLIIAGSGLILTLVRSPAGTKTQYAMNSGNFFRSEMILKSEQKFANPFQNPAEKSIFSLCETLKTFLIFNETGSNEIAFDFENKGQLLSDSSAENYFEASPEMNKKLSELRQSIQAYNTTIKSGQYEIPLNKTIVEMPEKRIPEALNDFVQIQMVLLQNQKALIAMK